MQAPVPPSPSVIVTGACFWTLQAVFESFVGVSQAHPVFVWMRAGETPIPSVDRHRAERLEAVALDWDPEHMPAAVLVEALLATTSPSLAPWNGGISELSGMRSAMFFASALEAGAAQSALQTVCAAKGESVHTKIQTPLPPFVPAPAFDVGYYTRSPEEGFCQSIIEPKLVRVRDRFAPWLRRPA